MNREKPSERGSFFFPILLIALGIVFLLKNLDILTGDIGETLLNLWPLLLVALGLDNAFRRHGLVGPIFLMGVGAVFLLANFGLLAINAWEMIIRLWPLLLIAIGLDIAVGHRSTLWSFAGLLILIALLIGTLWLYGLRQQGGFLSTPKQINQPLEGATRAKVEVQLPLGSIRFGSLSQGKDLLQGTVQLRRNEQFHVDYSVENGVGMYLLRSSGSMLFDLPTRNDDHWQWDLKCNATIPLDLNISLGAGISYLDLHDLAVNTFEVDMGVGETTVALRKGIEYQGKIDGAIGQTLILIPRGMAVRINTDTGLTHVQVPEDFQRLDDVYTSPGYDGASTRVNIEVSQAIGIIRIRYVEK
jgi:hypothetical protein